MEENLPNKPIMPSAEIAQSPVISEYRIPWVKIGMFALGVVILLVGMYIGSRFLGTSSQETPQVEQAVPEALLIPTATPVSEPLSDGALKHYTDQEYGVSFSYPYSWSVNQDSQQFENGDLVAVQFLGATQSGGTHFTDGARFAVMIPIQSDEDLFTWVEKATSGGTINGDPYQITYETISEIPYTKVYGCGSACSTTYYAKQNGRIYGFLSYVGGSDELLSSQLNSIFASLKIRDGN